MILIFFKLRVYQYLIRPKKTGKTRQKSTLTAQNTTTDNVYLFIFQSVSTKPKKLWGNHHQNILFLYRSKNI